MSEGRLQDKQFDLIHGELVRLGDELELIRHRLDSLQALEPAVQEMARVGRALEALAFAVVGREGPQVRRRA